MRAASATRDYDWAFERLAELWQPYQRSVMHRSAIVACVAHASHARLLLNHYVDTNASGDCEALVRNDLAQLARLSTVRMADIQMTRTRARLAMLRGDRAQALELMQLCVKTLEARSINQEAPVRSLCARHTVRRSQRRAARERSAQRDDRERHRRP